MGRGTSGGALAPDRDGAGPPDSDQRLVAAVRHGDDRAFEVLYQRYQRRIHAYVLGMVKDHGRAEDITQEVFVSALRRMRETEQPVAFKPWIHQIAKNSCIDAFRRSRRAEEVSYDADDALAPGDHSKLVGSGPSPDAAVAAKQDLDNLCGAFGGLSETHHEILVLRELEGLSYREIGKRMGMSRPAVESTLFRARRRLTEEYDDIVSGARCRRVHGFIVAAAHSELGSRDTRRLARHLSHCQGCRREALAAGLDRGLFRRPSVRERVAALLPLPAFLRLRRGADEVASFAPSGRGPQWASQLPLLSDHLSGGWGKAAAGAAMLAASVGAGAGVHQGAKPAPVVHQAAAPAASPVPAGTPAVARTGGGSQQPASGDRRDESSSSERKRRRSGTRTRRSATPAVAERAAPDGGPVPPRSAPTGGSNPRPVESEPAKDTAPRAPSSSSGDGGGRGAKPPVSTPTAVPADPVQGAVDAVDKTVQRTTGALNETVQAATGTVDKVVEGAAGGGPVAETVDKTTDTADGVVGGVKQTGDGVAGGVTGALGGITGRQGG